MTEWTLSIDFGTTYTCAVMSFGDETEVVLLNGEHRMPSAVLSDPEGNLVVGKLAELQGPSMPDRLERNPKRRLGDGIFLLGGEPVQVIKAVSEIMKAVADEATRTRGGEVPSEVRLTHPARWAIDGVYVRTMAEAVALARLPDPSFVSEPVAAARFFARGEVPVGAALAVYDLGGGTFDTTVLVRAERGFELLGRPGGIPDLGGEDFDESVFQLFGGQLDEETWAGVSSGTDRDSRRMRLELRRQAREAKEALSVRPEWSIPAPAPLEATLRITRSDFEDLIRDRIEETLEEMDRTIADAGKTPDELIGIYIAGGSSRIPLVQRMVTERFGPKVQMLDEPKTVVARGAALADDDELGGLATHDSTRARVSKAHKDAVTRDEGENEADKKPGPDRPDVPAEAASGARPDRQTGRSPRKPLIAAAVVVVLIGLTVGAVLLLAGGKPTKGAAKPTRVTHRATTTKLTKICATNFCLDAQPGFTKNTTYSDTLVIALDHAGAPNELVKYGFRTGLTPNMTATQVIQQVLIPERLNLEEATTNACDPGVTSSNGGELANGYVCYPGSNGSHQLAATYYEVETTPTAPTSAFVMAVSDAYEVLPAAVQDPALAKMYGSATPLKPGSTSGG